MNARVALLTAVVVISVVAATAYAHHSFAMFDMDKDVTYTGVVMDTSGQPSRSHHGRYQARAQCRSCHRRHLGCRRRVHQYHGAAGMDARHVQSRRSITLVGHPMKDGSKGISLFYAIMSDGKRLYHDIARPKGEDAR